MVKTGGFYAPKNVDESTFFGGKDEESPFAGCLAVIAKQRIKKSYKGLSVEKQVNTGSY